MCSVVEIKNESEYYIHYHSPESLETLASPQQSLEYQHLFKVTNKSNEESLYNSDSARPQSERENSSDDKDFSLEEITKLETKDSQENCHVADLEKNHLREEVCNDDDDNLDNSTNNEQNGGKVESVKKGTDRELKGLSQ